jgi:hypothetical protein
VDRVSPDQVGLNGLRARCFRLTSADPIGAGCVGTTGGVKWWGFTAQTSYNINGPGPFTHRRVLFKSTRTWRAWGLMAAAENPSRGLSKGDFITSRAMPCNDSVTLACLRALFVQDNIRGVISGPTTDLGVTVIRDEIYRCNGHASGVMKEKKYWYPQLRDEPVMKYSIKDDGTLGDVLLNSPESQHIYCMDVYSYGLAGLDLPLPTSEAKTGAADAPPRKKRTKSDDSSDSAMGGWSDVAAAITEDTEFVELEAPAQGLVSIYNEFKIYHKSA